MRSSLEATRSADSDRGHDLRFARGLIPKRLTPPRCLVPALVFVALGTSGCASLPDEVNAWPIVQFSRDRESPRTETRWIGPLVRVRKTREGSTVAVHPLVHSQPDREGDREEGRDTLIAWPLSRHRIDPERSRFHILPFVMHRTQKLADGIRRSFLLFPLFYSASNPGRPNSLAVFPLFGRVYDILGREEIRFALFPLYFETRIASRRSWNVLWPFFGWSRSDHGSGMRFWPFFAHRQKEGEHERTNILWPFFHAHRDRLSTSRPSELLFFFPFVGSNRAEGYSHITLLWPFFGFINDDVDDIHVTHAPWPILQWGHTPKWKRFRFWPFYGSFDSDQLRNRFYLWPIFWKRHEKTPMYERDSFLALPFFRNRRYEAHTGDRLREVHCWPLGSYERFDSPTQPSRSLVSIPDLNPFKEMHEIDRLYSPLWTVYRHETYDTSGEAEFFFGAVRNRWNDEVEHFSIPWLYGSRKERGGRVDRSLLLGLLGWTNGPEGGGFRIAGQRIFGW